MSSISIPKLWVPRQRTRWSRLLAHFASLSQRAGHLVRTTASPYHLSGCGAAAAPCTCAWPTGLSSVYTVSGWAGLSPCPLCDSSTDPAWSGAVNHSGSGCIWWAADANFDPLSIDGKSLDITYTQILLRTTVTPCRWELYIACASVTNPTQTMWYGYKTTGTTPAGTYLFVGSDCGNSTPTMTVS